MKIVVKKRNGLEIQKKQTIMSSRGYKGDYKQRIKKKVRFKIKKMNLKLKLKLSQKTNRIVRKYLQSEISKVNRT